MNSLAKFDLGRFPERPVRAHQSILLPLFASLLLFVLSGCQAARTPAADIKASPAFPSGYRAVPVGEIDPELKKFIRKDKDGITFFDVVVTERKAAPEDPFFETTARIKGATILKLTENKLSIDASEVRFNYPLPGMTTLVVPERTGGAECCYWSHHLTKREADILATSIDLDGAGGEAAPKSDRELTVLQVTDADLSAYSAYAAKARLALSGADSPRFMRFLVFDQKQWRVDKPGEFAKRYKDRIAAISLSNKQASKSKAASRTVAGAMELAYYMIMAGETDAKASEALRVNLPANAAVFAPAIFSDVKRQTGKFNPASSKAY